MSKSIFLIFLILLPFNIFSKTIAVTKYRYEPIYDYKMKPVYETVTKTYQDYEKKLVTEKVKVLIPPIIKRDNVVLAFTRFAGKDEVELEQIAESIKIGFSSEKINSKKRVKFISRAQLQRKLTRSELNNMGPKVEKKLRQLLGVNAICTGTVLNGGRLSIEVIDLLTDKNYSIIFEGSFEQIGKDVAKAFFGTRVKYETKTFYKNVPITKTRKVRKFMGNRKVKIDTGRTQKVAYTAYENDGKISVLFLGNKGSKVFINNKYMGIIPLDLNLKPTQCHTSYRSNGTVCTDTYNIEYKNKNTKFKHNREENIHFSSNQVYNMDLNNLIETFNVLKFSASIGLDSSITSEFISGRVTMITNDFYLLPSLFGGNIPCRWSLLSGEIGINHKGDIKLGIDSPINIEFLFGKFGLKLSASIFYWNYKYKPVEYYLIGGSNFAKLSYYFDWKEIPFEVYSSLSTHSTYKSNALKPSIEIGIRISKSLGSFYGVPYKKKHSEENYDHMKTVLIFNEKKVITEKKDIDCNSAKECYDVGYNYEYLKNNINKAILFYKKACNLNYAKACYDLAYDYEVGTDATPTNNYLSNRFYKKACKLGNYKACRKVRKSENLKK